MKALCVSAIASNQGKTILTMALLYHFKKSVRPFKIGPDFIDPQFHTKICDTPSINLDTFMMNESQVKWMFEHYSNKDISICEGVMGFYDGMDKNSSAYDISKLLHIPTILLLDGSSSYITVSTVLKGLKTYKDDNTIKAVVLNKISSKGHFELIKKPIEKDFSSIVVLGWIKKNLPSLRDTHLGLDLRDKSKIEDISKEVLEFIDMKLLEKVTSEFRCENTSKYPFDTLKQINKKLAIVNDENFSFLYHDNKEFLKEIFGDVETDHNYEKIKNSSKFKTLLISHAKTKTIYAECAGLLYLSNGVDVLSKKKNSSGDIGSWKKNKVFGTYLHTMFRNNIEIIQKEFI